MDDRSPIFTRSFDLLKCLLPATNNFPPGTPPGPDEFPQLWVKWLPHGPMTRLTNDTGTTRRPAWSPDGRTIAYITNDEGGAHARSVPADGSSASGFDVRRSSIPV